MNVMSVRCLAVAVLWLACAGLALGQGRALQFAGGDDRVDAALPPIFGSIATTDFTITTRVRVDQAAASSRRILFAQMDGNNVVSLLLNAQNVVYAFLVDAGTQRSLAGANNIAIGQWSEVAVRWTAATNTLELIVDGVPASVSGGSTSFGVDGVMSLGARNDGLQALNAALDDFAIWPSVLNDAQLATLWSGLCLSGSTPAVSYDFEVGQPGGTNTGLTTLPDLGASGTDGTLLGFALAGATSNWVASPYVPCGQPTAVSLAVSDAPDPVAAGAALTWTVDIGVVGAPASAVLLTGEVPAPAGFASLSAPAGMTCTTPAIGASGPVSCTAALLPVGTSSLTLAADVPADAVANSIIAADWSVSAVGDTDPSDDAASATTTIANQLLLVDDAAVTAFEQAVAIGVLANDGVAAGGAALDANSLQVATAPANGGASCTAVGCNYVPDAGFSGVDAFDYTVCEGSTVPVCGSAAVRIAVGPGALDDAFATAQATELLATVAGNDAFPPTAQFSVQSLPAAGTLALSADGSFSYVPAPGYAGGDSFAYQLCLAAPDATVCDAASVSLSVNATPLLLSPAAGALPGAVIDTAYPAIAFSASGGTAPYAFAVTAGALPPGLVLGAGGTLSGTPTATGSFAFTLEVTDSSSGSGPFQASAPYTLQVAQATQAIDFPVLPDATGTVGDTLQAMAVASSGLPVTLVSATPEVCTVTGTGPFEVTLLASGTCTLVASQAGDADTAPAANVVVSFGVIVSPAQPPAVPQPAVIPTLDRSWQLAMTLMLVLLGGMAVRRRG